MSRSHLHHVPAVRRFLKCLGYSNCVKAGGERTPLVRGPVTPTHTHTHTRHTDNYDPYEQTKFVIPTVA